MRFTFFKSLSIAAIVALEATGQSDETTDGFAQLYEDAEMP